MVSSAYEDSHEFQNMEESYQASKNVNASSTSAKSELNFENESVARDFAQYLSNDCDIPAQAFQTQIQKSSASRGYFWSIKISRKANFAAGLLFQFRYHKIHISDIRQIDQGKTLKLFRNYLRALSLAVGHWRRNPCNNDDLIWLNDISGIALSELKSAIAQAENEFYDWHDKEKKVSLLIAAVSLSLFTAIGSLTSFDSVYSLICGGSGLLFLIFGLTRKKKKRPKF